MCLMPGVPFTDASQSGCVPSSSTASPTSHRDGQGLGPCIPSWRKATAKRPTRSELLDEQNVHFCYV